MDIKTLIIAMLVISITYTIIFTTIAAYRKDRFLGVYAIGYAISIGVAFATLAQGNTSPWIGVVLLNFLYFIFTYIILSGVRVYVKKPFWTKRFFVYLVFSMIGILYFTFNDPFFSIRVIINSTFIIVLTMDSFFSVFSEWKTWNKVNRILLFLLALVYVLFNGLRIVLALNNPIRDGLVTTNYPTMIIANLMVFLSLSMWAMIVLIADYNKITSMLKSANRDLEAMAWVDKLTGLFNRHLLERDVENILSTANRYSEQVSFILFDLDNFKGINDKYGHDVGDDVLKLVVQTIYPLLRKDDRAYRWGGEEFLIILPRTPIKTAAAIAESMRTRILATPMPHASMLTISLGVTQYITNEPVDLWFKRVDFALLEAKKTGKNKIVVCSNVELRFFDGIQAETIEDSTSNDPKIQTKEV